MYVSKPGWWDEMSIFKAIVLGMIVLSTVYFYSLVVRR